MTKFDFDVEYDASCGHIRLDKGLNYDEPWGWMVPAEHALGALLLEQGQVQEAKEVFR